MPHRFLVSRINSARSKPGKLANVIVTNGDPLELQTQVRYLFIKGQPISTDNRHRDLYDQYRKRPAARALMAWSIVHASLQQTTPVAAVLICGTGVFAVGLLFALCGKSVAFLQERFTRAHLAITPRAL